MVFKFFRSGKNGGRSQAVVPVQSASSVEPEPPRLEQLGPVLWQDVRYGMALSEIRELHPVSVSTTEGHALGDGTTAPLEIPLFRLADRDFRVLFYCRGGRVTQITIATLGEPSMDEFRKLTGALRLRYGAEVEMSEDPHGFSHAEWLSAEGSNISLVCSPAIGCLNIVFQNHYSDAARKL